MVRVGAMVWLAVVLVGCVPGGGRGGGSGDDDARVEGDGDVDPDEGVPPGDMFVDPDDGIPPVDLGVEPDVDMPPVDMGLIPDGCAPAPESCNGVDDDCDGFTDEDFDGLGRVCETGVGLCLGVGEVVCDPGGGGTRCTAQAEPPGAEVCNGVDDDCDGAADEATDGGACETGAPGVCSAGRERCLGGEAACLPDLDPAEERCSGRDEDCDGAVDEGDVCDACAGVQCPDGLRCEDGDCVELPLFEEICDDDVDDDGDGFVDCEDFDCDDPVVCAGLQEFDCDNDIDEDGNGFVDCGDFACDDDPACQVVLGPECEAFFAVNDAGRNVESPNASACDQLGRSTIAFDAWVRFVPPAGGQLVEQAPPDDTCGTDAPGWLMGGHPAPEDGIVPRTVCFSWNGNECRWSTEVEVRDCDGFYVYRLPAAPVCSLQYCVE